MKRNKATGNRWWREVGVRMKRNAETCWRRHWRRPFLRVWAKMTKKNQKTNKLMESRGSPLLLGHFIRTRCKNLPLPVLFYRNEKQSFALWHIRDQIYIFLFRVASYKRENMSPVQKCSWLHQPWPSSRDTTGNNNGFTAAWWRHAV